MTVESDMISIWIGRWLDGVANFRLGRLTGDVVLEEVCKCQMLLQQPEVICRLTICHTHREGPGKNLKSGCERLIDKCLGHRYLAASKSCFLSLSPWLTPTNRPTPFITHTRDNRGDQQRPQSLLSHDGRF